MWTDRWSTMLVVDDGRLKLEASNDLRVSSSSAVTDEMHVIGVGLDSFNWKSTNNCKRRVKATTTVSVLPITVIREEGEGVSEESSSLPACPAYLPCLDHPILTTSYSVRRCDVPGVVERAVRRSQPTIIIVSRRYFE
jgi:hypothetical protein